MKSVGRLLKSLCKAVFCPCITCCQCITSIRFIISCFYFTSMSILSIFLISIFYSLSMKNVDVLFSHHLSIAKEYIVCHTIDWLEQGPRVLDVTDRWITRQYENGLLDLNFTSPTTFGEESIARFQIYARTSIESLDNIRGIALGGKIGYNIGAVGYEDVVLFLNASTRPDVCCPYTFLDLLNGSKEGLPEGGYHRKVNEDLSFGEYYRIGMKYFDIRLLPWYSVVANKDPSLKIWLHGISTFGQLISTVGKSYYDPHGEFRGVINVWYTLDNFNAFLQSIELKYGEVFMIDQGENLLLASSTHTALYKYDKFNRKIRTSPQECSDELVRTASNFLIDEYIPQNDDMEDISDIQQVETMSFLYNEEKWYIRADSVEITGGFKILIVQVMRDSDIFEPIYRGNRVCMIICHSVIAAFFIITILVICIVLSPLQLLSRQMKKVEKMRLKKIRICFSCFYEIRILQQRFRFSVDRLQEYKAFLPDTLLMEKETNVKSKIQKVVNLKNGVRKVLKMSDTEDNESEINSNKDHSQCSSSTSSRMSSEEDLGGSVLGGLSPPANDRGTGPGHSASEQKSNVEEEEEEHDKEEEEEEEEGEYESDLESSGGSDDDDDELDDFKEEEEAFDPLELYSDSSSDDGSTISSISTNLSSRFETLWSGLQKPKNEKFSLGLERSLICCVYISIVNWADVMRQSPDRFSKRFQKLLNFIKTFMTGKGKILSFQMDSIIIYYEMKLEKKKKKRMKGSLTMFPFIGIFPLFFRYVNEKLSFRLVVGMSLEYSVSGVIGSKDLRRHTIEDGAIEKAKYMIDCFVDSRKRSKISGYWYPRITVLMDSEVDKLIKEFGRVTGCTTLCHLIRPLNIFAPSPEVMQGGFERENRKYFLIVYKMCIHNSSNPRITRWKSIDDNFGTDKSDEKYENLRLGFYFLLYGKLKIAKRYLKKSIAKKEGQLLEDVRGDTSYSFDISAQKLLRVIRLIIREAPDRDESAGQDYLIKSEAHERGFEEYLERNLKEIQELEDAGQFLVKNRSLVYSMKEKKKISRRRMSL